MNYEISLTFLNSKVWRYLAKVELLKPKQIKIMVKTIDCIFIRYTNNSGAYRFIVHKFDIQDIHEDTIIESRNAYFSKISLHAKVKKI